MVGGKPANEQQIYQIGRHLQGMPLDNWGGDRVHIRMAPPVPNWLKMGNSYLPQPVVCDEITIPLQQAQQMQAQWKIDQQNKERQHWRGKIQPNFFKGGFI